MRFFGRSSDTATDAFDTFDDEVALPAQAHPAKSAKKASLPGAEGELPVDVHQTPTEIIIRAFVAGVRPDELSISISRDMVVIEGSRMEREHVADGDYFTRELFWGSFSRTILLPQEIDVDNSSASAKEGLLTITLPKLDKAKQTKLRVKAG